MRAIAKNIKQSETIASVHQQPHFLKSKAESMIDNLRSETVNPNRYIRNHKEGISGVSPSVSVA